MCTHTRTHAHILTHTHTLTHQNEGMQAKVAEATVVIADASDAPTDAGGVVNKVPQTPTHVASQSQGSTTPERDLQGPEAGPDQSQQHQKCPQVFVLNPRMPLVWTPSPLPPYEYAYIYVCISPSLPLPVPLSIFLSLSRARARALSLSLPVLQFEILQIGVGEGKMRKQVQKHMYIGVSMMTNARTCYIHTCIHDFIHTIIQYT
jgi:hypothetical protein